MGNTGDSRRQPPPDLGAVVWEITGDAVALVEVVSGTVRAATSGLARLVGGESAAALVGRPLADLHSSLGQGVIKRWLASVPPDGVEEIRGVPCVSLDGQDFFADLRLGFAGDDGVVLVCYQRDEATAWRGRVVEAIRSAPGTLGVFAADGEALAPGSVTGARRFVEFVAAGAREEARTVFEDVVRTGRHGVAVLPLLIGDGREVPHTVFLAPFIDDGGPTILAVGQNVAPLVRDHDLLRALFASRGSGLVVAERETRRILDANDAAAAMLGYSPADLRLRALADLNVADEPWAATIASHGERVNDLRFRCNDGAPAVFDVQPAVLDGASQDAVALILRPSSDRLRDAQLDSLLDQADVMFAILESDGSTVAMTHWGDDDGTPPTGDPFQQHAHEDERERLGVLLATAASGVKADGVFGFDSASGATRSWSVLVVPILDGRAVRQLLVFGHDVTDAVATERERALIEARYRALVEQLPHVTYRATVSPDSAVTWVSPQIEDMLGHPATSWIGPEGVAFWKGQLHPDDGHIAREWSEPDRDRHSWSAEYRLRHADGHFIRVLETCGVVNDESGVLVEHGSIVDITAARDGLVGPDGG